MSNRIKKLFNLIKRIYINNDYTLDDSKGFYASSTFLRRNVIFFYEIGCFFQKQKFKFLADFMFSVPYLFFSVFGLRNLSFSQICYLFNSDKSLARDKEKKFTNLVFTLADNYDRFFYRIKNKKLKILEIGIGGHVNPNLGGSSLRSLSKFFNRSEIFGIDIIDKKPHERKRIKTFLGSQMNKNFLEEISKKYGPFDIIIDDGSHYVDHQIHSFNILFPFLNDNGMYFIEDMLSSHMRYMGGSINIDNEKNLVSKFSKISHSVYSEYILIDELKKLKQSIPISSMLFFCKNGKGCIFIEKAENREDGRYTTPEHKLSMDDIKKSNPDHKLNRKSPSGVFSTK